MKNTRPQTRNNFLAIGAAALVAASMLWPGSPAQAQSSISGVYPNGTNMFQPSSTLSFTASSPAGVTNVTVQLTVTSLYNGQSFVRNLSSANGLIITGPNTGENVSCTLNSNTLYSATIQVKDATGNTASQTFSFDTINPVYTWEAEDWNYTSNGVSGLYIDNPQTNGYAALGSTDNVDAHNSNGNSSSYRPGNTDAGNGGLYTETIGSPESNYKRLPYINTGKTDYDVGFTDGGDFGNYTRTYPAGTYNLFVRASGGNGSRTESADITVTSGNASISSPASGPYKFGVKGNGWQSYDFMPVTDSAGNLAQITFDGNPSTLNVLQNQASDNMNFFMLMPLNTNVLASTVTISNVSPDGSALYNQAGTFSFAAGSSIPLDPNNIVVQVRATNLWLHGWSSNFTATSGLTITGQNTNWNVSFPTTSNTIYSVYIQITDGNGTPSSTNVTFDTIVETYTFEAEDFDYGGGNYVDNPQTNAYFGLDGTAEVDYHLSGTQHGGDYNRVGLTTEGLNEKLRPEYNGTGKQDYDVGFNDGGNWGNYTRNYPAGTYNIWVRAANGTGNNTADSGSISEVTSGRGSTTQTLVQLGKFSVPPIAWSTYSWVPVKDPAGNLAQFSGGALKTLRMTIDGGNCNENFFLLTPIDPQSVLQPYVDGFTPDNSAMFEPSNTLSFVVHSQPGATTNNIVLNLNGANVSGMTFSGTPNIRTVTYPVQLNAFYTAIVTVTDANGTVRVTNNFATFTSTNYQWEAEDYDHDSGQFTDNPQVGSYLNVGSVAGVDNVQADLGASPFNYRLNSNPNYAPATTPSGDQARDQFVNAGATDYNIGFFGHNSWANYTRHYPAGTYNIVGRFAEGNAATEDTMSVVTSGYGTSTQTTNYLGTFQIPAKGWGTWEWAPLTDSSGNPIKVTLDGTRTTLQLGGTPFTGHDEANVNFFMLVAVAPSPKLTTTINAGNIQISFPTQTGYSYQLLYKNQLSGGTWTSLGSAVSGNGSTQSVSDSLSNGTRFYRVQVSAP